MMAICHYTLSKPTEYTTPGVNHKVNCGYGVTLTYQCWFLSSNPYTTPVRGVDNGEAQDIGDLSVTACQFCCELKTTLKK